MQRCRWFVLLFILGACEATEPPLSPDQGDDPEFTEVKRAMIVVLAEKENPHQVARDHGIAVRHVYQHALNGFAGEMADIARSGLLRDYRVVRVRPDEPIELTETQLGAAWNLDRIDQRAPTLDGGYTYQATGEGVTAYIVDTGIDYQHAEFGGRAIPGFDAFGGDAADCHGHGTHVAGTVGGAVYGVAKRADLVGVRVLDCAGSGTTSSVLAGIEWILANGVHPAVVNMSFGGPRDDVLDDAVRRLYQAGFVSAIAAGNSAKDACDFSPARSPEGITIGATQKLDGRALYSNFGDCIDWFAPGNSITSAAAGSGNGTTVMSGTSMAAPHVAGAAALYLQDDPTATPQQTIDALASFLTRGVVSNAHSQNNHLLFALTAPTGVPRNAEPVARFTVSCSRLACEFLDASTDSDGTVVSRTWNFGDGTTVSPGSTTSPHTYVAGDIYRVTLVVRDDDGTSATWASDVPVGLVLSTLTSARRNRLTVNLSWKGAETTDVVVYVNGSAAATVANSGSYRMTLRTNGSYTVRVCETGSAPMCSAEEPLVF